MRITAPAEERWREVPAAEGGLDLDGDPGQPGRNDDCGHPNRSRRDGLLAFLWRPYDPMSLRHRLWCVIVIEGEGQE